MEGEAEPPESEETDEPSDEKSEADLEDTSDLEESAEDDANADADSASEENKEKQGEEIRYGSYSHSAEEQEEDKKLLLSTPFTAFKPTHTSSAALTAISDEWDSVLCSLSTQNPLLSSVAEPLEEYTVKESDVVALERQFFTELLKKKNNNINNNNNTISINNNNNKQ